MKPDIDGQGSFKGAMFHTSEWDNSVELAGKRIGIIGTGSTATQIIAELPEHMTVFQRTAQWVVPLPNKEFSEKSKQKCRDNPLRITRVRKLYAELFERVFTRAIVGNKFNHALLSFACRLNLRLSVKDRQLRKKLTPAYTVGCKRLVMSSSFYPAIQRPNIDLVTEDIDCITETGIRTVDGTHYDLDVLVQTTGFNPLAYMRPINMTGRDGIHIEDSWKTKVRAYRSLLLPDHPNFFLMLGPNAPIGNFSVIALSEIQTSYVLQLIERWRDGEYDELACTQEALERFNRHLKSAMKNTVWTSGCQSWYLDADGDPLSWPFSWAQWQREMAVPDMADFAAVCFNEKLTPVEETEMLASAPA